MKKKNNNTLWVAIAALIIFIGGVIWGIERKAEIGRLENMVIADKPVISFNFLEDKNQTIEINVGPKVIRMASEGFEGSYEKEELTTTFKHSDGRKVDRYIESKEGLKHFTDYFAAPPTCEETCLESEVYTFENAILHKANNGEVKLFYFDDLQGQAAGADPDLVSHAARSMRAEMIKSFQETDGANSLFKIPIPFVINVNGGKIPVEYTVGGEKSDQLTIRFKAQPDQYPLTLDPTLQLQSNITGEAASDRFGSIVRIADIDNDNDDDLIISSVEYNSWQGRVYIFYNDGSYATAAGSADVIITGETIGDRLGMEIATGDMDNDNDVDLIIGANAYNTSQGRAYIFYNDGTVNFGTAACSGTPALCSAANADIIITGEASSVFGWNITTGDLDNDNDADLAISGRGHNSYQGRVYVFYQDATLWGTSSCTTGCSAADADVIITGETIGDNFGGSLRIGDLDSDTDDDLAIASNFYNTSQGRVYIFYQDATLWGTSSCTTGCSAADADVIITGEAGSKFGGSLATGSLDGDTDDDLAIGAYAYNTNQGRAYILYQDGSWPTTAGAADVIITGETGSGLGWSLAISDIDDDTDQDLIGGAIEYNTNQGRAYIFYNDGTVNFGTATCSGTPALCSAADADLIFTGESTGDYFGISVASGDLDDDNDTDLAIGSHYYNAGTRQGRTYLYYQATLSAPSTTAGITNQAPFPTATPSDGGSSSSTPTIVGSDATFTVTAKDVNADQYYLAICKTDAVTVGNDTFPTCDGGKWPDANPTATNSASQATETYTTLVGDVGSNAWYAFVCDKLATASSPACYPANAAGDQGLALGTITFTGVPVDGATVTIDSIAYEFDTANNGISAGTEVDTSASVVGAEVAIALAAVEAGTSSHMIARSNVAYVYADTAGAAGNSIAMAEAGDSGAVIALSGANLAGGSADNASPFVVVSAPAIGTVTIGDTSGGGGLNPATGTATIAPDDTVYFNAAITNGTVDMYVCDSAGFTYGASPACTGTEICNVTSVNTTTDYAECSSATVASAPHAHGTYTVYIYAQNSSTYTTATGTNNHDYSVIDVAPALASYTATDAPAPTAGGSDTVDFSVSLTDGNGDNDVTAVEGVLFDDTLVGNNCTSDENDCYIDTTCTLTNVSTPGAGKLATGTDTALGADCQVTFWYNGNASANWEVHANPTDGIGKETGFADSTADVTNPALQALDLVQASLAYGTLALGKTSSRQTSTIQNMGNQTLDVFIDGDTMCTDYATCAGDTINFAQQKWYHTDTDFNWGATATAPGPYTLVDTASGTDDETGCLNRDIAVRNDHTLTTTNESIWWKMQIPINQALGSYTGQNTFSAATSTTCSAAQSY